MVKVARILRDYGEAGAVNSLIALWGFVDDHTFLTKAGHVGLVYRLRGTDAEGLTHPQRQSIVHQFEAALRLLDEHCRLYQYVIKQTAEPFVAAACARVVAQDALRRRADYLNERRQDFFRVDHFLVLLYEPPTANQSASTLRLALRSPRVAFRDWLSTNHTCALLERELDRAISTLHQKARAVEVQLSDCGLHRLAEGRRLHLLSAPGELRHGHPRRIVSLVRHASGLLRRGLSDRVPPRSSDRRAPEREGPFDEGAAISDVCAMPWATWSPCRVSSSRASNGSACRATACAATSSPDADISSTSVCPSSTTSPRRPALRKCLWTTRPGRWCGNWETR